MYDYRELDREDIEEQIDDMYDSMRDDFLFCDSVLRAIELIKRYGNYCASKYLPKQYKYLIE